ncbi:MAG TPA: PqqD family peptide modification chaperone, partial [Candidatus Thermoplasmatota archaeon]|nr:PqqD family peptide modification chaperone [Candidatus Thermoplasmatota archaeon]
RVAERVEEVRAEQGADGRVTLRRRRFGAVKAKLVAAAGVPADLTVHLDALGSSAWRLIDGQRTVAAIRAELGKENPDQPDLGARLGKFLGTMVSNGFVRLR